jgi:hypothetical protein
VLRFRLLLDAPHHLHYRASDQNVASPVPSNTQWRSYHKRGSYGLARLSLHLVQLKQLMQEPRGYVSFSKLTQPHMDHVEQAQERSN